MREKQLNNSLKWILGGTILCIFLLGLELLIATLITQNDRESFISCYIIIITFTMSVYVIIVIVKLVQYQKCFKEYNQEKLEEAKEELSSEFKTVLLNNSINISEESFECQAKVDNDGKIICKIHFDFETKMDSYEEFLRYFHFNEE